jgi:hypothetical protein
VHSEIVQPTDETRIKRDGCARHVGPCSLVPEILYGSAPQLLRRTIRAAGELPRSDLDAKFFVEFRVPGLEKLDDFDILFAHHADVHALDMDKS